MLFVPYLLNRCFSVLALLHLKIFLYNSKIESVLNAVFSLFLRLGLKSMAPPQQQQQPPPDRHPINSSNNTTPPDAEASQILIK